MASLLLLPGLGGISLSLVNMMPADEARGELL
jgi:hypothetical protein